MCDRCHDLELRHQFDLVRLKAQIYKQIVEHNLGFKINDELTVENLLARKGSPGGTPKKKIKRAIPPPQDFEACSIDGARLSCGEEDKELGDEEQLFAELKEARNYTPLLERIKKFRVKANSNFTSFAEITNLIQMHIEKLELFLSETKGWSPKKISQTLGKAITPLEQFLVQRPGFERNNSIDMDEMLLFKQTLARVTDLREITVYDPTLAYSFFTQPYIAFMSCEELIKVLVEGHKNIVYLQNNTEGVDDYSFYTLGLIEDDGQKKWKMDCRLEKFTTDVCETIRNYCLQFFRSIYFQCMKTNAYVDTYRNRFAVLDFECEMLLSNFYKALNFTRFNRMVRDTVKNQSIIISTAEDEHDFDFLTDNLNSIISDEQPTRSWLLDETKLLFDNLSDEDAERILLSTCSNL